MTHRWDPDLYARFTRYRERPALDLLLQIPTSFEPREIWDLGCGDGELTVLLKTRHPKADVYGLDASPHMMDRARTCRSDVTWIEDDITRWTPRGPVDMIFTNSALQWVPDHEPLFGRLMGYLNSGGMFACQMPTTHKVLWREILCETVHDQRWMEYLADAEGPVRIAPKDTYYRWLKPWASRLEVWSTTYLHILEGEDPVFDWMRGTVLRPYLQALPNDTLQDAFLEDFRQRVDHLFPREPDGTILFPFPRLFIVAQRS